MLKTILSIFGLIGIGAIWLIVICVCVVSGWSDKNGR